MKKIIVLLLCLIISLSVFAEILPENFDKLLSISTFTEYTTTSVTTPSITVGAPFLYFNTGFLNRSTQSETVWYPYLGPNRISHKDFFLITGQDAFADQYQNYERALSSWQKGRVAGFVFLGASSLLTIVSSIGKAATKNWSSSRDPWSIALYVGIGTLLASAVVVPIVEVCRPRRPDISINFAVSLADTYNQRYVI